MKYTAQADMLSQLAKLTLEQDKAEFDILRYIIDKEIAIENRGFKGSEEDLFNAAIYEIGVPKIRAMMLEYNQRVDNIQSKIMALESK